MVEVLFEERKSAVLTPSSLACLAHMPTVNLTAGCAHQCRYCYTCDYKSHPGEGKVRFYTNTLKKLREELQRKRTIPKAVYFSPSSDIFQPIPAVLDMAYKILEFLLDSGIGVALVTKGRIPDAHRELLVSHAPYVRVQIGLITLDENISREFEPFAAPPETRLAQAAEFITKGIETQARLDPILPNLTDNNISLERLCRALAEVGVKSIAASVLFLRPGMIAAMRRHIQDKVMLGNLLNAFSTKQRLAIHAGNSQVTALPLEVREKIFNRLKDTAQNHGLKVRLCACKNPDITSGVCNISGQWPKQGDSAQQLRLLDF